MIDTKLIRKDDRKSLCESLLNDYLQKNFDTDLEHASFEDGVDDAEERAARAMRFNAMKKANLRRGTAVFHPGAFKSMNLSVATLSTLDEKEKANKKHVSSHPEEQAAQNEYLAKILPPTCEGAVVLVGTVEYLEKPAVALIRLSEELKIPYLMEVALSIRFIFILFGPESNDISYREVGRSLGALLSNKQFQSQAYQARTRTGIMTAMNDFLDDSLVLPPGKFDKEALLPFDELKEKADMIRMRKRRVVCHDQSHGIDDDLLQALQAKFEAGQSKPTGPLQKTGRPWGGMINDLKRRMPFFKSDIVDGLNPETIAVGLTQKILI